MCHIDDVLAGACLRDASANAQTQGSLQGSEGWGGAEQNGQKQKK